MTPFLTVTTVILGVAAVGTLCSNVPAVLGHRIVANVLKFKACLKVIDDHVW